MGVQYTTSGLLFKNLVPTLPTIQLATKINHWRQMIRLHTASSGATKGFIELFFVHMRKFNIYNQVILYMILKWTTLHNKWFMFGT